MIKEIRTGPRYEETEYKFKLDHAIRFLGENDRVKITVMFKGRESAHKELGEKTLLRFAGDLENYAKAELPITIEPKKIFLIFTPKVGE